MQRSRLSNMAFYVQSLGEIVILAVIVGVMYAVDVTASVERNNWGLSVLVAFATGVWLLLALPWFVLEKRRPGQKVPTGMNMWVSASAPVGVGGGMAELLIRGATVRWWDSGSCTAR